MNRPPSPWTVENVERNAEVVRLRQTGLSYRQIAKAMEITETRAWQIFKRWEKRQSKEGADATG